MQAIERLKRDHAILRSKLDVLEGALKLGVGSWFILREVCYTLSHQLADHIRREEALVVECRASMSKELLTHLALEHTQEPGLLQTLNDLFLGSQEHSLALIKPILNKLIERLRDQMQEEDVQLFPVLECFLISPKRASSEKELPTGHLNETMAVNYVLREYPSTKSVFERLFINVPFEGCDCLDEVAWRRGMEVQHLLRQLEGAILHAADASSKGGTCNERMPPAPHRGRVEETAHQH